MQFVGKQILHAGGRRRKEVGHSRSNVTGLARSGLARCRGLLVFPGVRLRLCRNRVTGVKGNARLLTRMLDRDSAAVYKAPSHGARPAEIGWSLPLGRREATVA